MSMRLLAITTALLLLAVPASARSEIAVEDGGAETEAVAVFVLPGELAGIISYCVWYLPDVAGGVGWCYNWETNRFCLNEPTPADVCVQMDEIPFLDEDQLFDFLYCIESHYILIPDVPPHDCWSALSAGGSS